MNHKVAFSFADGKTLFLNVLPNELLLDAALRNGINIPLDCREGVCGTCQGRCETGSYSQDYVDDETLTPEDLEQGKVLSCQTRVLSNATFFFDFESSLCNANGTTTLSAKVKEVKLVSENTAILHIDASNYDRQLDFLPGQYARIKVPGTNVWRAYSFANMPNPENQMQFLIRLLPDGVMSNYLRTHGETGQEITLDAPLGAFYLRRIDRPVVMAAGGTGLSAFLGMLDEIAAQGSCGHPIKLFYGVNSEKDLCEQLRLEEYRKRILEFTYDVVVVNPGSHWEGKTGFIPDHFAEDPFMRQALDMYMCGPPPMVEAIKHWLVQNQVDGTKNYYEKFTESVPSVAA